jgi:hypothetical protein
LFKSITVFAFSNVERLAMFKNWLNSLLELEPEPSVYPVRHAHAGATNLISKSVDLTFFKIICNIKKLDCKVQ